MRRNFTQDQTLVDQLLLNDTDAFEELYHRHWYSLYSYSFGKLKSHDDAKRIVRDVFVSLWEKREHLPISFSLSAYLYTEVRSAVLKCINNKQDTVGDINFIEKQIIPGFSSKVLYESRQPVSIKNIYARPGRLRLSTNNGIIEKESWTSKHNLLSNFKGVKNALQTMLNF